MTEDLNELRAKAAALDDVERDITEDFEALDKEVSYGTWNALRAVLGHINNRKAVHRHRIYSQELPTASNDGCLPVIGETVMVRAVVEGFIRDELSSDVHVEIRLDRNDDAGCDYGYVRLEDCQRSTTDKTGGES